LPKGTQRRRERVMPSMRVCEHSRAIQHLKPPSGGWLAMQGGFGLAFPIAALCSVYVAAARQRQNTADGIVLCGIAGNDHTVIRRVE
jgi:hypothetical protein